jgi:uncharacterized membrane protein YuzA (DUF378 family)
MRKTNTRPQCGMARAVCGTAGVAATLVRLSAGIAAVACLGWFVKEMIKAREEKKKNDFTQISTGKGH